MIGKLHYLLKTATGQKIIIEEKKCRAQTYTMFLVKDAIPTSESEIRGTSEFFLPPPPKKIKIFLLLFYIFQDILRLSKNKFRVESLKTRRKFFRPPLKRVENFLAPPPILPSGRAQ